MKSTTIKDLLEVNNNTFINKNTFISTLPSNKSLILSRKFKKILLIQPYITLYKKDIPRSTYPLGLAYIASFLENYYYQIQILDALAEGYNNVVDCEFDNNFNRIGLSLSEIKTIIENFSPDVVGISNIFTNQLDNVLEIAEEIKKLDSKIITVIGGASASYTVTFLLKKEYIDFVLIGESELSFFLLLESLNKNYDIKNISGIGYKNNDNVIIQSGYSLIGNPKANNCLDVIPFPSWHLLKMESYFENKAYQSPYTVGKRVAQIITSRGCTANCTFCSTTNFWGNCFRTRSADNVYKEIEFLKAKYNIDEFHIQDDNLTNNLKRSIEILNTLKKINLPWATPQGLALWKLNEEILMSIKQANAYQVTLAIESGSQRVLKELIRKPLNLLKTKHLIKFANKIGLHVHGFFIIGMPPISGYAGESIAEMEETFKFALDSGFNSASFFIATPLIGTLMFDEVVKNGYIDLNTPLYKIAYKQSIINVPNLWSSFDIAKIAELFSVCL
jgi:radical SAM superfamily enzyme YgiQ (UPF0313 family)